MGDACYSQSLPHLFYVDTNKYVLIIRLANKHNSVIQMLVHEGSKRKLDTNIGTSKISECDAIVLGVRPVSVCHFPPLRLLRTGELDFKSKDDFFYFAHLYDIRFFIFFFFYS